ncbi:MAG: hypothetical protein JWP83_4534 [Mycobacterium sp.]|jgi:hypothetical protein|nr:hypothetical protein [Mycobacterium sp.]
MSRRLCGPPDANRSGRADVGLSDAGRRVFASRIVTSTVSETAAVALLADDDSSNIHGATLSVDVGWAAA